VRGNGNDIAWERRGIRQLVSGGQRNIEAFESDDFNLIPTIVISR